MCDVEVLNMKIDYMTGFLNFNAIKHDHYRNLSERVTVKSDLVFSVENVSIEIKNIYMEFICLKSSNYYFFYQDERKYQELLRIFYDNGKELKRIFLQEYSSTGAMKELLISVFCNMCEQYKTTAHNFFANYFHVLEKPGRMEMEDVYLNVLSYFPVKVTDNNLYDKLQKFLPENIEKQREYLRREKAKQEKAVKEKQEAENHEKAKKVIDIVEHDYNSDSDFWLLRDKLSMQNGISMAKIRKEMEQIDIYLCLIESFSDVYISKEVSENLVGKLTHAKDFLTDTIVAEAIKLREKEYGTIESLKHKLRISINRLSFEEALDTYRDYMRFYDRILEKKSNADKLVAISYKPYLRIYRYGAIILSNRMNQLHKNKARTKHIDADTLDKAMCFYYETENISEAYEIQKKERYAQEKESGDVGERKVEYALQWLDKSNISIEARSQNYAGLPCIKLLNTDFIDIAQEFDHIIVGPRGVFIVETKNFAGKIIVDKYGNWIRRKQDEEIGMTNPLQQMRQHEKILKSFLPSNVKVTSILCIANDKAIIEGSENFPMPIIKSDMLVEFLETYGADDIVLSQDNIKACCDLIYDHMV